VIVAALRAADVSAGCMFMVVPVKSAEDRPRSPWRGPARDAQCPHEQGAARVGKRCDPGGRSGHGRSCSGALGGDEMTQGRALQLDPVRAMDDAIEDRVGQGGIADPSCQRLTGTWLVINSEPRS
jgi:hypothetical protein